MPNKIPWSYFELLHEIYNYPDQLRAVTLRMRYHDYHFYWCKQRPYMAVWSTLKNFMDHPEKWTANYQYEKDITNDTLQNTTTAARSCKEARGNDQA